MLFMTLLCLHLRFHWLRIFKAMYKKHSKIPWLNNGCILQCPLQSVSSDLLRFHWTGILYPNKIMLTEFPVLFVILKSLKITPEFLFCSGYDYNNQFVQYIFINLLVNIIKFPHFLAILFYFSISLNWSGSEMYVYIPVSYIQYSRSLLVALLDIA